ncbi:MAG: RCC1 repeat-containing protein, partial [Chloroflexota bacterium]
MHYLTRLRVVRWVGLGLSVCLVLVALPLIARAAPTFGSGVLSAGQYHTCALFGSALKCWGFNASGQLGDGTTADRTIPTTVSGLPSAVVTLTTGTAHSCALTIANGVWCWGANSDGQLGDGTTTLRLSPVSVSALVTPIVAVAAGDVHTCALTNVGGALCWGANGHGQLGDGTLTPHSTPASVSGLVTPLVAIVAGDVHSCALTNAGAVLCWGDNTFGQLGDSTNLTRTTPVNVSGLASGVTAITAGAFHTCALTNAGGAQCWGRNNSGQLGDGTNVNRNAPVNVSGLASGVSAISGGAAHTCALIASTVNCWGGNTFGQLGDGTNLNRSAPVSVSGLAGSVTVVAAGGFHTCALLSGGNMQCWGYDGFGQLGHGTIGYRNTPTNVSGAASGVITITAGSSHNCLLLSGGAAECWGYNAFGQLGDGTLVDRAIPVGVSGIAGGGSTIAAGGGHSCAVVSGGARCWGDNTYGQLGDSTNISRTTPVNVTGLASGVNALATGGVHSCALVGGAALCWGYNLFGQLGDGTTTNSNMPVAVNGIGSPVSAIAAGGYHTCALTNAGVVKCWGANSSGQLGDNTTVNRALPVDVIGLTSGVVAITAGNQHTCALTNAGGVKCWGYNGSGQLGDNTTANRALPVDVIGLTSGVVAI